MAVSMVAHSGVSKSASNPTHSSQEESKRTVSKVFVKTRKCRFFGMGICTKGDACTYAHAREELRPVPDFSRTKLCPSVVRGEVCNNAACKFAHAKDEKRKLVGIIRHKEAEVVEDGEKNIVQHSETPSPNQTVEAQYSQVQSHNLVVEEFGRSVEASVLQEELPVKGALKATQNEEQGDKHKRVRPRGCRAGRRRGGASSVDTTEVPIIDAAENDLPRSPSNDIVSASQFILNCADTGMIALDTNRIGKTLFKTRMCRFYAKSACAKGSSCPFAHQEHELRPLPDSNHLTVCPDLISKGECNKPNCTFAHSIEELRCAYQKQSSSKEAGSTEAASGFSRSTTPSTDAEESDYQDVSDGEYSFTCSSFSRGCSERASSSNLTSCCPSPPPEEFSQQEAKEAKLLVQNTFLTFEPPQPPLERRLRRVNSAPCCLGQVSEDIEDSQGLPLNRRNARTKTAACIYQLSHDESDDENFVSDAWLAGVDVA